MQMKKRRFYGNQHKAIFRGWFIFKVWASLVFAVFLMGYYTKFTQAQQKLISPLPHLKASQISGESAHLVIPTPTSVPTKLDIIKKYPHADILERIHFLESTNGKATHGYHKGCEDKGKSNEFGYGVYNHVCFDTFEDSVEAVSSWFTKHLEKASLGEALCIYNLGIKENTCDYAQNFLTK